MIKQAFLVVCGVLVLSWLGFGQQDRRQEYKNFEAKRERLRSQAKQAFDEEMAREKAGDCPNANNTYEFNICFGAAAAAADQSLKKYEDGLWNLLGLENPSLAGLPATPGPAGPALTPAEEAQEFLHVEEVWRPYLNAACTAAFHRFGGGTGGPSAELECHLRMVRTHMKQLNTIYNMMLYH